MKVAIIGAGASGLMLSRILTQMNISYTLFERKKPGRKLLASGNGRCNISNINVNSNSYLGNSFAYNLVKNNQKELFNLFNKLNIYTYSDDEGRLYPISESSQSVFNILTENINNIKYITVNTIIKNNNKYYINNEYGPFDYVAITIGSNASINEEYSYSLLSSIGVKYNEFKPSLVGFKLKEKTKEISGVRQKCTIKLLDKNNIIYSEKGEVIFKNDGISGICIMNASAFYNHYPNKNNLVLAIDLLNGKNYNSLESVLKPDLLDYINKYNLNPSNLIFNIIDTYDIKNAQVGYGGISLNEINDNLSYKMDTNIYFGGEVLDCDGVCGGYNLMIAFCSAIAIARSLYEISNK